MKEILIVLAIVLVMGAAEAMFPLVKSAIKLRKQRKLLNEALSNLATALGLKDAYTETRGSGTVAAIAVRIARAMHLPKQEVKRIEIAAKLGDIGKVGVSGKILRKPGPLDPTEWSEMQRHPIIGEEIMKPVGLLSEAAKIVRHHHEHYDGSGYPDGLKGEDIPLGSRIVLVANAFKNITLDTPYRRARSKSEALHELKEHAGSQFDPEVVRVFGSMIDRV